MSLTEQTTLTKNAPMILDATCSELKIWPRFASLRMDRRREAKPDIVADARFLPFRPGTFDVIYCDPPHMIRKDEAKFAKANVRYVRTRMVAYGAWPTKEAWLSFLKAVNKEFKICLRPTGEVRFKVTNGVYKGSQMTKRKDMEEMDSFEVSKEKITHSFAPWCNKNTVHWLTMKPKPPTVHEVERDETP